MLFIYITLFSVFSINEEFILGLTVQPQKMEIKEVVAILNEYEADNFY
ncbi:hypothetical protein [Methanobrevibacter filiformis]|nr:hypothetical protein [Methanobrevibacter filiformis]